MDLNAKSDTSGKGGANTRSPEAQNKETTDGGNGGGDKKKKAEDDDDPLRGGFQKQRDRGIKQYPKDFQDVS